MSDDNMHTQVRVDTASDTKAVDSLLVKIRALGQEFRNLGKIGGRSLTDDIAKWSKGFDKVQAGIGASEKALKALGASQETFARARVAQEEEFSRIRKAADSEMMASLRRQIDLTGQLNRQRIAGARDAARAETTAARDSARGWKEAASAASKVRSGVGRAAVVGAAAGVGISAGARRGIDKLTRSGVGIDDALVQSQIHIYGTQSTSESRKSALALRERLMSVAVKLGSKTSDLIGAYVEASQTGVDSEILDKVVGLGAKYAKMNKLNLPSVLEESGYALQGLKSFGTVTDEIVGKYFNHMSYLVATTAANRSQMSSFGKRGMSAGASVGMSPDDTLAFGAAGTAAGGEGNQIARMLSSQSGRAAGWAMKARDLQRKRNRTEEDRLFLQAPAMLGFGSFQSLAANFKKDFFNTFAGVQESLKKVIDPLKRRSLEKMLFGQEFGALTDAMVMGGNLRDYRKKLDSPEANGFIDQNWSKQTGSFQFIIDQIRSVFGNLSDSLGLVLKPFWSDLRDWAVQTPKAFQQFEDAFTASIKGFLTGLGSPDGSMAGLLKAWLGDPADFKLNAASWGSFARGFGDGIRSVVDGIKRLLGVFSGGSSDPEVLGRLAGKLITLSSALVIASPAITLLGALSTAVLGFATAFRALGVVGAGGSGAAGGGIVARLGLATLARRLLGGLGLSIAAELGAHRGEIATMLGAPQIAGLIWDGIKAFLGTIATDLRKALSLKLIIGAMTPAWIERWSKGDGTGPAGQGGDAPSKIEKESASETEGWRSLISPIGYTANELSENVGKLAQGVDRLGARLQLASLSTGGSLSSGIARSAVGSAPASAAGLGYVPGAGGAQLYGSTPGGKLPALGSSQRFGGSGEGGSVSIGSGPGTVAKGTLSGNQQQAYQAARAEGLSDVAARALVANMSGESLRNPRDHHWDRSHMSQGIVQWDPQRAAAIQRQFGKLPKDMTVAEQTRAALWEMKNNKAYAPTWRALQGNDAGAMLGALVRNYERPQDKERAIAERSRYYRGFKPNAVAGDPALPEKARETLGGKPGTYGPAQDVGGGISGKPFQSASELAKTSPAEALAKKAPPQAGGAGAGAQGPTIHAPINLHGVTDGEKAVQAVSRHLNDAMKYSTRDYNIKSI